jgi:hypothetical protein
MTCEVGFELANKVILAKVNAATFGVDIFHFSALEYCISYEEFRVKIWYSTIANGWLMGCGFPR